MEGTFNMITNYAPYLHKTAENTYYQEAKDTSSSRGKGLLQRQKPIDVEDLNNPKKSMENYFSKIRMMREQFNGNT